MSALRGYLASHLGKAKVPSGSQLIDYQAKFDAGLDPRAIVNAVLSEGVSFQAITSVPGRDDLMTFEQFREGIGSTDCCRRPLVNDEYGVVLQTVSGQMAAFFPSEEYITRFERSKGGLLSPYHEMHLLVVGAQHEYENRGTLRLAFEIDSDSGGEDIAYGVAHFGAVPKDLIGFFYPGVREIAHLIELFDWSSHVGMEVLNGSCSLYMSPGNDLAQVIVELLDTVKEQKRPTFASSDAHPTTNPRLLRKMIGSAGLLTPKFDLRNLENGGDVMNFVTTAAHDNSEVFGRPWDSRTFAEVMIPPHVRRVGEAFNQGVGSALDTLIGNWIKDVQKVSHQ
jgi:hypothetical protein